MKLAETDEEPRKPLMTVNRYICAFDIYWILGLMLITKMNKCVIEMKRTSKEISPFGWPGWGGEAYMYVEGLYGGQRSILVISPQALLIRLGQTATETQYSTYFCFFSTDITSVHHHAIFEKIYFLFSVYECFSAYM